MLILLFLPKSLIYMYNDAYRGGVTLRYPLIPKQTTPPQGGGNCSPNCLRNLFTVKMSIKKKKKKN